MALSAYEFQRSYWFGGVFVLIAIIVPESDLADQAEWLSALFTTRLVAFVAVGALAAPILFTALSEFAFWWTLKHGEVDASAVARALSSAPVTSSGESAPAEARYLLPVEFQTGGFKQVLAAFFTRRFKSYFLDLSPYSVWLSPKTGRRMDHARRAIFLARTGDRIDIEKIGKSYRAIRVCDRCWILDQVSLEETPDE